MIPQKVLITGCGGMLGSAVYPYFLPRYESVLATDKDVNEDWLRHIDVRDDSRLSHIFEEYRPDIVIHLAAETDLEYCETHAEIAEDTNAHGSRTVAELAEQYQCVLAYVSTAGVFDGRKNESYTEKDTPNPIMVYGRTKHQGELYTSELCRKSFIVRAGWMMGGGREKEKKFIYKILTQIGQGKKELFAVNDLWGTPTYSYDFARNLFMLLKTEKYGTYHMACEGRGTRYDVCKKIVQICNRPDIKVSPVGSDFFKEEYFVKRPRSEMMINENLTKINCNYMRRWEDALRRYIETDFSDYINIDLKKNGQKKEKASRSVSEPLPHDESRGC